MIIKMSECEATSNRLLETLGQHEFIDTFLEEITGKKHDLEPLDLAVRVNGKCHYLISSGEHKDDLEKILAKIRRLPNRKRRIQQDHGEIYWDPFERELFVNLDAGCC